MSFIEPAALKSVFKSDGFRGLVLPLLYIASMGLSVWLLGLYLWDMGQTNLNARQVARLKSLPRPVQPRVSAPVSDGAARPAP